MSLTILGTETMLPTDSSEYDILTEASKLSCTVDGMSCEIGLRRGGGSRMIIDSAIQTGKNRTHVMVDPYGNIEYKSTENTPTRCDYTNDMKHDCMMELHAYYRGKMTNLIVFIMEDSEFFNRFADGVPVYTDGFKNFETQYAMVHLDGPHDSDEVLKEANWFSQRMLDGAFLVCDDTHMYPHFEKCHESILKMGFYEHRRGVRKISYVRDSE